LLAALGGQTSQQGIVTVKSTSWACLVAAPALLLTDYAMAQEPADTQGYGPLSFNIKGGGDFYFAQGDKFAAAHLSQGGIEIHLRPAGFQIGYNGEQMNSCLAQTAGPEIRTGTRPPACRDRCPVPMTRV
jgi:hypothetical protein